MSASHPQKTADPAALLNTLGRFLERRLTHGGATSPEAGRPESRFVPHPRDSMDRRWSAVSALHMAAPTGFAATAIGSGAVLDVARASAPIGCYRHSVASNSFAAASPTEGQGVANRLYTVALGSRQAAAGGLAGIIARTASAPLDRVKLLFQVQAMEGAGVSATAYTGIGQAFAKIYREEGILAFWRGNGVNVIRVAPYAAAQLSSNDFYKKMLTPADGKLGLKERLCAGAMAGMTGTALTHPLDTIRLRLALPNHGYSGISNAFMTVARVEGVRALYKGLIPTLAGIAPYAAINFASYDVAKKLYYGENGKQDAISNLFVGGASGTFSATICYPLDTVRRRMQMKGKTYNGMGDAFSTIFRKEGMGGFFKGWVANTLKVVPQNSIRFVAYETLKTLFGVATTPI